MKLMLSLATIFFVFNSYSQGAYCNDSILVSRFPAASACIEKKKQLLAEGVDTVLYFLNVGTNTTYCEGFVLYVNNGTYYQYQIQSKKRSSGKLRKVAPTKTETINFFFANKIWNDTLPFKKPNYWIDHPTVYIYNLSYNKQHFCFDVIDYWVAENNMYLKSKLVELFEKK